MGDTFSEVERGNSSGHMNGTGGGVSLEKFFGSQHWKVFRRAGDESASYARGSVSFLKDSVDDDYNCGECNRKSMMWGLSEPAAKRIAIKIRSLSE